MKSVGGHRPPLQEGRPPVGAVYDRPQFRSWSLSILMRGFQPGVLDAGSLISRSSTRTLSRCSLIEDQLFVPSEQNLSIVLLPLDESRQEVPVGFPRPSYRSLGYRLECLPIAAR